MMIWISVFSQNVHFSNFEIWMLGFVNIYCVRVILSFEADSTSLFISYTLFTWHVMIPITCVHLNAWRSSFNLHLKSTRAFQMSHFPEFTGAFVWIILDETVAFKVVIKTQRVLGTCAIFSFSIDSFIYLLL